MKTRKFTHSKEEAEKYRKDINYIESGTDDNGNVIFHSIKIEDVLSEREKQVYDMKEKSNEDISIILGISVKSVDSYRNKIKSKGF